jgi:hypothetical protein
MDDQMPPPDENPFASPQEASAPETPPPRRLTHDERQAAGIVGVFATIICFVTICSPWSIGLMSNPTIKPTRLSLLLPWVVGGIVGLVIGWVIYRDRIKKYEREQK